MDSNDQLRRALRDSIDTIDVADDDPVTTVHGVVRRRRNRRRGAAVIGSVAAVAVIAVSGFALLGDRAERSGGGVANTTPPVETTTPVETVPPVEEGPVGTPDELVIGPEGIVGIGDFGDPFGDVVAALTEVFGPPAGDEPEPNRRSVWWEDGLIIYESFSNEPIPANSLAAISFGGDSLIPIRTTSGITIGSSEAEVFAAHDWLGTEVPGANGDISTVCVPTSPGSQEGNLGSDPGDPFQSRRYLHTPDHLSYEMKDGVVTYIQVSGAFGPNSGACQYRFWGVSTDFGS